MSMTIDLSAVTNMLNQVLPLVMQVAVIGLVLSIVFQMLFPMIREALKATA